MKIFHLKMYSGTRYDDTGCDLSLFFSSIENAEEHWTISKEDMLRYNSDVDYFHAVVSEVELDTQDIIKTKILYSGYSHAYANWRIAKLNRYVGQHPDKQAEIAELKKAERLPI